MTANMKQLALVLLFCALPSVSQASCFINPPQDPESTHCVDHLDKTRHAVGSSWRNSGCLDCTCSGCCTAFFTPRQFPDDCVSVFDSKNCEFIVHKKDDHTQLCPVYGSVGK